MTRLEIIPADWKNYVGEEIGTSDWFKVTQEEINEYGKLVDDMQ